MPLTTLPPYIWTTTFALTFHRRRWSGAEQNMAEHEGSGRCGMWEAGASGDGSITVYVNRIEYGPMRLHTGVGTGGMMQK